MEQRLNPEQLQAWFVDEPLLTIFRNCTVVTYICVEERPWFGWCKVLLRVQRLVNAKPRHVTCIALTIPYADHQILRHKWLFEQSCWFQAYELASLLCSLLVKLRTICRPSKTHRSCRIRWEIRVNVPCWCSFVLADQIQTRSKTWFRDFSSSFVCECKSWPYISPPFCSITISARRSTIPISAFEDLAKIEATCSIRSSSNTALTRTHPFLLLHCTWLSFFNCASQISLAKYVPLDGSTIQGLVALEHPSKD